MLEGVVSSALRPIRCAGTSYRVSYPVCYYAPLLLTSCDACVFTSCAIRYSHALRLYLDPRLCRENWIQLQLVLV